MNETTEPKILPRLRIAGALIVLGLLIEALTLSWNNPIAFIVFLGLGGLLLFVGIAVYLLSLVSQEPEVESGESEPIAISAR